MKCPSCGEKYISNAKFCSACGDKLKKAPFKRKVLMRAKIWLAGGLTGMGTGLSFILVHDALTTDLVFDLWEFGVALVAPGIIAIIVAKTTKGKGVSFMENNPKFHGAAPSDEQLSVGLAELGVVE